MAQSYVVKQGDHLPAIAASFGFQNWRTLWEDPENAELRKQRSEPTLLAPGDVVRIPSLQSVDKTAATGQRHRFVLKRSRLRLRVRVLDPFGQALAHADCELVVDGSSQTLTSDGNGIVEAVIPPRASAGVLRAAGMEFPLRIGHLDPLPLSSGLEARLVNLGYYPGAVGEDDPDSLAFAVELLQRDLGLPVTGVADDVIDAVRDAYGC
jgi:hypothetical protein